MKTLKLIFLLIFFFSCHFSFSQKLRVEIKNGKKYIVHKVQAKETVYSIAKNYELDQEELIDNNPGIDKVLKLNQLVYIPTDEELTTTQNNQPEKLQSSRERSSMETHIVQKGEWLTKIANKYGVSVTDLKEWNQLTSEKINLGQELIVGIASNKSKNKNNSTKGTLVTVNKSDKNRNLKSEAPSIYHTVAAGESLYKISKTYGVTPQEVQIWNNLEDTGLKNGQTLKIYPAESFQKQKNTVNTQPNNTLVQNNPTTNTQNNTTNNQDAFGLLNNNPTGNNPNNTNFNTTNNSVNNSNTGQADPFQNQAFVNYQVGNNENLYGLSKKFTVEIADILRWNNMNSQFQQIYPGQRLLIYNPKFPSNAPYFQKSNSQTNLNQSAQNNAFNQNQPINNNNVYNYNTASNTSDPFGSLNNQAASQGNNDPLRGMNTNNQVNNPVFNTNNPNSNTGFNQPVNTNPYANPYTQNPYNTGNSGFNQMNTTPNNNQNFQNNNPQNYQGNNLSSPNDYQNSATSRYQPNNNLNQNSQPNLMPDFKNTSSNNNYLVTEKGFAEMVQNIQSFKPYVARHRKAPVGSLVIVRNPANGKSHTVEVVEFLNAPQLNDNLIIQLTPAVFEILGAAPNSRLVVEIQYMPR